MKKFLFVFLALWMAFMPLSNVLANGETDSVVWIEGPDGEQYEMREFSEIQRYSGMEAAGCKIFTKGISMKNLLGQLVFKYSWKIDWCYNGTTITSLNRYRVVNVYGLGVQFLGDITDQTSGGSGQTSFWGFAQGDFCFVNIGGTCFSHHYPWVQQEVFGTGSYQGTAGW